MARYKAPGIAVYQTIQQNNATIVPDQNVAIVGPSLKTYSEEPDTFFYLEV